jgi:hypothetical protein
LILPFYRRIYTSRSFTVSYRHQQSPTAVVINRYRQLSPSIVATMPTRQTANIPAHTEKQFDGISIKTVMYVDP